jgi:hypothetical protein
MVVLVLVTVVLAGAAGILARRWLRTDSDAVATAEGLDAGELWTPLRTLVALVLAFVLVQTFSSFQDAGDAATREASAVSGEATSAGLLPAPAAAALDAEIARLERARSYLEGALLCRFDHPATDCRIMGQEIDRRLALSTR